MAQLDAEEAQLQQKLNSTQDYTRTEGRCPKRTVTVSREGERQQIRDAINKNRQRHNQLTSQRNEHRQRADSMTEKAREARNIARRELNRMNELQSKTGRAKQKLNTAQGKHRSVSQQLVELKQKLSATKHERERTITAQASLEEDHAEVQLRIRAMTEEANAKSNQRDQLGRKLQAITVQLEDATANCDALAAEVKDKEREIREKKAKTALIRRQKDGVVSQLARLQEEQRSAERQLQQQKDLLNVATAARATALQKKEQLDQLLKTMQDAKRGAEAYYQRTRPAIVPVGAQRSG
jgi:chromosome segregation ATPase